jgi:hypothetical protein
MASAFLGGSNAGQASIGSNAGIFAALTGLLMVVGSALAAPASADVCGGPTGSHCYSTQGWTPASGLWFTGAEATALHAGCMSTPGSTDTENETVWQADGPSTSPKSAWIEAGLAKGYPESPTTRFVYWASKTTQGGYFEHDSGGVPWTPSANYDVKILLESSGYPTVTIVGSGVNLSDTTVNPQNSTGYFAQAGLETDDSTNGDASVAGGLTYYGTGGNPNTGWSDGTHHATASNGGYSGNTSGSWITQYTSWQSYQNGGCS